MKELAGIIRSRTGINQIANIGVTGSNDAIKRSKNALITLQLFQPAHIGSAGVDGGLCGNHIAAGLICFLLRYGVFGQQALPAIAGHTGEFFVGLHPFQLSAGLLQLLIDLWRVDDGQYLPLLHMSADIEEPLFEIAIGARVDGSLGKGLHVTWKHQFLIASAKGGMHHTHGQNRGVVGLRSQLLFICMPLIKAITDGGK